MPDTGEWSEGASQQRQLVSERNFSRSHGLINRSAAGWRKEQSLRRNPCGTLATITALGLRFDSTINATKPLNRLVTCYKHP
jgi:hypothetical protein